MSRVIPDAPQFVDARSLKPFWMRAINRVGRLVPGHARLSSDALWANAARKLGEPGREPVAAAREALGVLADSVNGEARVDWIGRIAARDDTQRMARTCLAIDRERDRHPEIANTALPPMLFIIGLPRTGTTGLHQLLAQDPANRTLPYWESFDPVPPAPGKADLRSERLEKMLRQLDTLVPEIQAIHPMSADVAEECVALFMNVFRTLQFDIQYRIPGYIDWLLRQDARLAYQAYRRQLELVWSTRPFGERLLLKDPTHIVHLSTILDLFPDAKFIFIHRDPTRSISSICSLYAYTRAIFTDHVDREALGDEIIRGYWPEALDAAETHRRRIAPGHAVDVRQSDLVETPLEVVEQIYRALGLDWSDVARDAMAGYLAAQARMTKPRHVHRLEGFGLRPDAVRDRFRAYRERFDV